MTSRVINLLFLTQFSAAELATNNEAVQKTVAEARKAIANDSAPYTIGALRLQEADLRSRIGFTNAQLRYLLDHRELLLRDLKRVLDATHQRSNPSASTSA